MTDSKAPPEFNEVMRQKGVSYSKLLKGVTNEDRSITLDGLIKCAITDIQMLRMMFKAKGAIFMPIIDSEQETEFEKKLREICG